MAGLAWRRRYGAACWTWGGVAAHRVCGSWLRGSAGVAASRCILPLALLAGEGFASWSDRGGSRAGSVWRCRIQWPSLWSSQKVGVSRHAFATWQPAVGFRGAGPCEGSLACLSRGVPHPHVRGSLGGITRASRVSLWGHAAFCGGISLVATRAGDGVLEARGVWRVGGSRVRGGPGCC